MLMATRRSGGYAGLKDGSFAIRQHSPGVDYTRFLIDQNGRVGIGTDMPDGSALLEAKSTDKGMLISRMTQA